jgi:hypothetical protein
MHDVARMKLEIMARGILVGRQARDVLAAASPGGLTDADYPTTSGLTLVLPGDVYVNAPVDEWYCDDPAAELLWSPHMSSFELRADGAQVKVRALPLPGYLATGHPDFDSVRTHADRVRLSPISGCACSCSFCDLNLVDYRRHDVSTMVRAVQSALDDSYLPGRHTLISGGTPRPEDRDWLDAAYVALIEASPVPVDVMLMPRATPEVIDMLVAAGVDGLSINVELYGGVVSKRHCPQKAAVGLDGYAAAIRRAVELTGGAGRVRSLMLVGLEEPAATLAGVEFIASLGADPVLSPFRPAEGTATARLRPPSAEVMERLHEPAQAIAERYGVQLGPRCVPCMHNTLAFPGA